ncbi:hypothetical protein QQX10_08710 [Demequina sp. SYSU T00039]|uniref:AMIN-like domain-containing protein n=1 Tax=Demequina lignilytica TaxID=3051663 RepID=A0AAW7M3S8_9MICO|nr:MULTISPECIES: hypothetical protein [unclassified Demequina]MDN4477402.1 hypothetical protein [Demequina sp. SYSU T00039-1]MDN4488247.1 hypothetical protein [Demequina sp. SYSU T00039]
MSRSRRWLAAIALTATLLAGCSQGDVPEPSPSATSQMPSATATPSPAPTPTPTPSPTPTCEAFGTEEATASSDDWGAHLSPVIWGSTMRLGTHDCYDRWVLEFAGATAAPGWSVTPYEASTFTLDPSGEELTPALAGAASLDVAFGAWVDGTPLGEDAYTGPMTLAGGGAILEARILGGFEGISHVGIGLDQARPYRVTWLEDPVRLVVDVFTG